MIRVRLNSATQVTKEKLQQQLKQLNCTYTVSNDSKQIVFQCPSVSVPLLSISYSLTEATVDVQMAKTNALKGNISEVAQRIQSLIEEYDAALDSTNTLLKWLSSDNGKNEIKLLTESK